MAGLKNFVSGERKGYTQLLDQARQKSFDRMMLQAEEMGANAIVVSIDYFKKFLANLRGFFGGEVRSYESLLDRGRREAVLRMKEESPVHY